MLGFVIGETVIGQLSGGGDSAPSSILPLINAYENTMLLDSVVKDSTDYTVKLKIAIDTTGLPKTDGAFDSAGLDLWYHRPGSVHTSITEVTTTEGAAHTDGGFVHVSDGKYDLDLPDAAIATGVDYVDVGGTIDDGVVFGGRIRLTDNIDVDSNGYVQIQGTANTLDDLNDPTAAEIVNEWETQSQADPTGFHVNLQEVGGTAQTSGDLANLISAVNTLVTAVKAVTDQMVFSKTNELDVNTKSINDAEVVGDGNGTPWDGA